MLRILVARQSASRASGWLLKISPQSVMRGWRLAAHWCGGSSRQE
jgi:hypothetical protein